MNSAGSLPDHPLPAMPTPPRAAFPEEAFDFVREGLRFTVDTLHGHMDPTGDLADSSDAPDERRHVSGQQLCMGMKEFAIQRYGMLAGTVLERWGIRKTDDFGAIVYAMIERGDLKASPNDNPEDFKGVFDFAEVFGMFSLV